jgi:hypothetical protein
MFGWPESFGGHNTIAVWLHSAITYGQTAEQEAHTLIPTLAWTLALISTVLSLLSAGIAWKLYSKGLSWEEGFERKCSRTYQILREKYFVDQGVMALIIFKRDVYETIRCFRCLGFWDS